MSVPLLSASDLTVKFGGLVAVNQVSFDVRRGEVFTIIGPNGAGKTTVFNLISRIYQPTSGSIHYNGQDLVAQPPHAVAALGIARTFQNIELFEFASVLQNLLIGTHTHRRTSLWQDLMFTGTARRAVPVNSRSCHRLVRRCVCVPMSRFCNTLANSNSSMFWKVRAMPSAATACGGCATRSWPL